MTTTIARRAPGSPAANQYGEFSVHYGTDRQVRFAARLARERDTTGLDVPADLATLNKRHLSDLIDALVQRPARQGAIVTDGASDKQVAFIAKLAGEKDWEDLASPSDAAVIRHAVNGTTTAIKRREASSVIDWLMTLRRKQQPVTRDAGGREVTALEDGIYRTDDGDILKVYHTVHGANVQVAKRLRILPESERYTKTVRGKEVEVKAEFVYEGKRGLAGLTPAHKVTLEQAKQYGAVYGVCVRCAATLTNEVSIEASMGPVCRGYFA